MSADLRALIDRLADALGPDASAEQVERVARAVLAARRRAPVAPAPSPPQSGGRGLVLAFGPDAPGLLAAVAAEVAAAGASVLDVSAQRLGGHAALLLLVDLASGSVEALDARLRACPGCALAAAVEATQP